MIIFIELIYSNCVNYFFFHLFLPFVRTARLHQWLRFQRAHGRQLQLLHIDAPFDGIANILRCTESSGRTSCNLLAGEQVAGQTVDVCEIVHTDCAGASFRSIDCPSIRSEPCETWHQAFVRFRQGADGAECTTNAPVRMSGQSEGDNAQ